MLTREQLRTYQKGYEDGVEMGAVTGQRKILLRLLDRRFGPLPESVTRRVADAGTEEIKRWTERLFDAASLDDVFALLPSALTREDLLNKEVYDRGYQQGTQIGMSALLLDKLAKRFGTLPESVKQRVAGASTEELERWLDRLLDTAFVDDVFAAS